MADFADDRSNTMHILEQQLTGVSVENQYLSFFIGEEEYAVEVLLVQEIIRYTQPTRVPNAPRAVRGVINFRGKIIPVLDMRRKFSLEDKEYDSFNVIIVLKVKEKIMGMVVDSVSDVLSFSDEDIQDTKEEMGEEIEMQHIKGLGKLSDERLIQIIAPDKMLSIEELVSMQNVKRDKLEDKGMGESGSPQDR